MIQSDLQYCFDLVQANAQDLYLADLLLPKELRNDIIVLHAFHVEITNITLANREPLAGEVRLQWWADVLAEKRADEADGHPVARALLGLIKKHNLSNQTFDAKLEAHIFDLYQDPMGNLTMLEGYLGETRSILFQLSALTAAIEPSTNLANASGHAGVATGLVGLLEHMALHRNMGKVYVPTDLLSASGLSASSYLATPTENHSYVILAIIDLAQEHYEKAIDHLDDLRSNARVVFKPLALVPYYLERAKKTPERVLTGMDASSSQLRRQWALWRF